MVTIASYDYDVYADGQRSQVMELDGAVTQWSYDNLKRLKQEKVIGGYTYDYTYDLVGNRFTFDNGTSITYYQYNAQDQMLAESPNSDYSNPSVSYGYDNNGSLESKTITGGDTTVYGYNLQNRMESVTVGANPAVVYKYDPSGIRISKQNGASPVNHYLVDAYNPTGYTQVLKDGDDTFVIGSDIIAQDTAAGVAYLIYDGHGSVRHLADTSGSLISGQTFNYDGYGNRTDSSTEQTNLLYTGEWQDKETNSYCLRARYYTPVTGTFNRLDPFVGFNGEPQSLHKYAYCHSNPLNYIDPTGQSIWDFIESMEEEQALRILIGIRVTYTLGNAYINEERRNKGDVDINLQIARMSEMKSEGIKWNGLYKKRPDISDRTRGDVYEIRPDNTAAITKGYGDVKEYIRILQERHSGQAFFPGAWQPKKRVYMAEGIPGLPMLKPLKITARNAGGGVIAYRIDDNDLGERIHELLQVLAISGVASAGAQISQALTVSQAMNVGQIAMQKAVMVPMAETVELKDDIGIAQINATMGAF